MARSLIICAFLAVFSVFGSAHAQERAGSTSADEAPEETTEELSEVGLEEEKENDEAKEAGPEESADSTGKAGEPALDELDPALQEFDDESGAVPEDDFEAFDTAEDEFPEGRLVQTSDVPLSQMDRQELRAAGFVFGEGKSGTASSTATILALTVGIPLHGVGHLVAGDSATGSFLLVVEAVSLGLMATSGIYYALAEGSLGVVAATAPVFQLGAATFVHSWLLDILGTTQGDELRLESNIGVKRGISFAVSYGLISAAGSPVRHLIDATLDFDFRPAFLRASTQQDVLLNLDRYHLRTGFRPFGTDRLSFLEVRANGDWLRFSGTGPFERYGVWATFGGSFGLGRLSPRFDQVAFTGRAGAGHDWMTMPTGEDEASALVHERWFFPFETALHFNLTSKLNFGTGYGTPRNVFVPAPHRLFGVGFLDFLYRSSDYADVTLRAEIGDGVAVWIGGRLFLL